MISCRRTGDFHFTGQALSAPRNIQAKAGDSYYDGDADNYVIPLLWELYDLKPATARNGLTEYKLDDTREMIGKVSGHLILTSQIVQDGYDPVAICDVISEDLRYVMSVMTGPSGLLDLHTVSSDDSILYIHEIKMEPAYETPELTGRVIRELPWICMKLMHIRPEIIAYCISEFLSEDNQDKMAAPYMQNGLIRVSESNVLYAYKE